ncbi:MAG: hypothetical protein D6762_01795 [Candidatus Neomarinimicrobiota bacterium]|nr:MAG: hypothetical protein D6762_01795 [Candidatus Neomarinimicrobiota bacterium]
MKSALRVFTFVILVLGLTACRKQITATEVEMAEYGWDLYAQKNFTESNHWFANAILQDSTYKDGYNGLGWTFGKLMELDSSVIYFTRGLPYAQDPNILANTKREMWAGLCFANEARGTHQEAIAWGDSLLTEIAALTPPTWSFSHDTTLNHLDIHLTMAMSYYSLGRFSPSLDHVRTIVTALNPTASFTADTTTVAGRQALANEIETLRGILATP